MNVRFTVRALTLADLCGSSVAVYIISLEAAV